MQEQDDNLWIEIDPDSLPVRLPDPGKRCLFSLNGGTFINGRGVIDGWKVFGYRCDQYHVFLPFFNCTIPIMAVHFWKPAPGPDYWNGSLRPIYEFMEA